MFSSFLNSTSPLPISELSFFSENILLKDAIALWYKSNVSPNSVNGHNNLCVIKRSTEYVATLISPSRAKNPPINKVAVNPNKIATLIIGINAADNFIAW